MGHAKQVQNDSHKVSALKLNLPDAVRTASPIATFFTLNLDNLKAVEGVMRGDRLRHWSDLLLGDEYRMQAHASCVETNLFQDLVGQVLETKGVDLGRNRWVVTPKICVSFMSQYGDIVQAQVFADDLDRQFLALPARLSTRVNYVVIDLSDSYVEHTATFHTLARCGRVRPV